MLALPEAFPLQVKATLLFLPDDILDHILYSCDAQTVDNLSKLSSRFRKLTSNPRLWCYLIVIAKDYDDFTFCYKFNPDVISYHKNCLRPVLGTKFNLTTNRIDNIETLFTIWEVLRVTPNYQDFLTYANDNKLIKELSSLFEWSLNAPELYRTFSSSLLGFYRVLVSAFNWKETCRRVFGGNSSLFCENKPPIFSAFCHQCRCRNDPASLLGSAVNKTGSHQFRPFDALEKEFFFTWNGRDYYRELKRNYIIYCNDEEVYCVGILEQQGVRRLSSYEVEEIKHKKIKWDKNDYIINLINVMQKKQLDVEEYQIIDGVQLYKAKLFEFIIKQDGDNLLCLGRLHNDCNIELTENERTIADKIGLVCI